MKKVKFNVSTAVEMRPDENEAEYKRHYKEMRFKDFKSFSERLKAGSEYEFKHVKPGDIIEVPDAYYEENKDRQAAQGLSFDHYTDEAGNRVPFDHKEAKRHGDITKKGETMKYVPIFELVEDGEKPKSVSRGTK